MLPLVVGAGPACCGGVTTWVFTGGALLLGPACCDGGVTTWGFPCCALLVDVDAGAACWALAGAVLLLEVLVGSGCCAASIGAAAAGCSTYQTNQNTCQ